MKRNLKSLLSSTVKAKIGFTGKKLSTSFQIKDQTKFEHKHDIIYLGTCPQDNCSENYIGESGRQISERIIDHKGRDQKSHIFKHSSENCHQHFYNSFKIIGNGFKNSPFKRKFSEALLIKQIKPSLLSLTCFISQFRAGCWRCSPKQHNCFLMTFNVFTFTYY